MRRLSALALLVIVVYAIGGCGSSDDVTSDSATAAASAQTTTTSTSGSDSDDDGDGGGGGQESSGGQDQGDQDEGGDSGGGQGEDDADGQGSGAGSASGDEFASQLRTIVGEAFVELRSLVAPATAMTDPDAYADQLEDGAGDIDDTIDQLQALDPPADAEEGTEGVIAAFTALRGWVAAGAEDYASGDRKRIADGLAGLQEGAAQFRAEMGKAIASLRRAGYGLPGS
ncbi:MAG: hypothetical protein U0R24_08175 [Solirubrobacterales bacterium]